MPFIALDKQSRERIVVTKLSNPRDYVKGRQLECQLCGGQMFLKGGSRVTFHFFHRAGCHSNYKTNPESPEHIAGKSYIAETFLPLLMEYADFKPEYEVPLPEIMRVADVLVSFKMGWRIAHEIQISPISVADLDERTADYLESGIDVIWWFGKSANTVTNREWSIKRYGFSLNLMFDGTDVSGCGYCYEKTEKDRYGRNYKAIKYKSDRDINISNEPAVLARFAVWWLDYAFARYYQVWQRGNNEKYVSGLGASKRTLSSFNGKTGAGKDKWCKKESTKNGEMWVVDIPVYLRKAEKYEIASRLSLAAVQHVRERVKIMSGLTIATIAAHPCMSEIQ